MLANVFGGCKWDVYLAGYAGHDIANLGEIIDQVVDDVARFEGAGGCLLQGDGEITLEVSGL